MSLWEIIVDGVKTSRGQKVEPGMNVDLNFKGMSDPFCSNEGKKAIADAFQRKSVGGVVARGKALNVEESSGIYLVMDVSRFISRKLRFQGNIAAVSIAVSFFVMILAVTISSGFRHAVRRRFAAARRRRAHERRKSRAAQKRCSVHLFASSWLKHAVLFDKSPLLLFYFPPKPIVFPIALKTEKRIY